MKQVFFLIRMKRNRYREKKKAANRTYPPKEMWSLYKTISAYIAPRLDEFNTYYAPLFTPGNLVEKYGMEKGNLEWRRILRKMKYTFDQLSAPLPVFSTEENKKIEEGLQLFTQYFRNLWH